MRFKRILLKLSGEALLGTQSYGIDAKVLEAYAKEVKKVVDAGVEVAVVIGVEISSAVFKAPKGVLWIAQLVITWACWQP